jgi:hypothetical protein
MENETMILENIKLNLEQQIKNEFMNSKKCINPS